MNSRRRVGWAVCVALVGGLLAQEAGAVPIGAEWVPRQLTSESWVEAFPMFSPDGSLIGYIGTAIPGEYRLYVVNSDGTNPQQLTFRHTDAGSFTRDGQYFLSQGPDPTLTASDIWRTKPDGSLDERLWTTPGANEGRPSELPDGRIVTHHSMDGIWICSGDGSDPVRLTPAGNRQQPQVSRDGRYITYMSQDGMGTPFDIYVFDIITGTERRLTSDAANQGYPSFSPDGQWIIYQSMEGGGSYWDVFVLDTATGTQRYQLTDFASMHSRFPQFDPAYPDGSRFIFSSYDPATGAQDLWEVTAVPEPSTAILLVAGVMATVRRLRRRR